MNFIDIIIWAGVIVALVLVVRRMWRTRKAGGGCAGCTACSSVEEMQNSPCHKQ